VALGELDKYMWMDPGRLTIAYFGGGYTSDWLLRNGRVV